MRAWKKRSTSAWLIGPRLVARQARDLRVAIPAHDAGQVVSLGPAQRNKLPDDLLRMPHIAYRQVCGATCITHGSIVYHG